MCFVNNRFKPGDLLLDVDKDIVFVITSNKEYIKAFVPELKHEYNYSFHFWDIADFTLISTIFRKDPE